jgi:hypothetical protein
MLEHFSHRQVTTPALPYRTGVLAARAPSTRGTRTVAGGARENAKKTVMPPRKALGDFDTSLATFASLAVQKTTLKRKTI